MNPTHHTLQNAGMQDPRGRGVTWIAMLAISSVLHAESLVECAVRFPLNVLPYPWLLQFGGVTILSFLLGLSGFFVDRRALRIGFFSVRAFAIALFIAPFSEYNATKLALLYAFFLETGFELDPPASVVLAALASFFMVGLAQSGLRAHPPPLLENPIDFVFQYLLDAVLSWNALFAPLIVISDAKLFTIPLGIRQLATNFRMDNAAQILGLTLTSIPILFLFALFSRSLISGLSSAAVKG